MTKVDLKITMAFAKGVIQKSFAFNCLFTLFPCFKLQFLLFSVFYSPAKK